MEGRGKDEKFEDQAMPKHFHNTLKRQLLCNYRNDGLMVFLAIEKKKKYKIIAEKRPLHSMTFFSGSSTSGASFSHRLNVAAVLQSSEV